ncbi:Hypothetical protein UVM_LOCUS488 [uncultured virus]|nr:Hypothetical protein UVM_LOCUS488 [uncultured virus]
MSAAGSSGGGDVSASAACPSSLCDLSRTIAEYTTGGLFDLPSEQAARYAPILNTINAAEGIICAGKCLGPEVRVLLANGRTKHARDVVVGDALVGDDGTARLVLETYRGRGPRYLVKPEDDDPSTLERGFACNDRHLLVLFCDLLPPSMASDTSLEGEYVVEWSERSNCGGGGLVERLRQTFPCSRSAEGETNDEDDDDEARCLAARTEALRLFERLKCEHERTKDEPVTCTVEASAFHERVGFSCGREPAAAYFAVRAAVDRFPLEFDLQAVIDSEWLALCADGDRRPTKPSLECVAWDVGTHIAARLERESDWRKNADRLADDTVSDRVARALGLVDRKEEGSDWGEDGDVWRYRWWPRQLLASARCVRLHVLGAIACAMGASLSPDGRGGVEVHTSRKRGCTRIVQLARSLGLLAIGPITSYAPAPDSLTQYDFPHALDPSDPVASTTRIDRDSGKGKDHRAKEGAQVPRRFCVRVFGRLPSRRPSDTEQGACESKGENARAALPNRYGFTMRKESSDAPWCGFRLGMLANGDHHLRTILRMMEPWSVGKRQRWLAGTKSAEFPPSLACPPLIVPSSPDGAAHADGRYAGRFLLADFTVTHNTTFLKQVEKHLCETVGIDCRVLAESPDQRLLQLFYGDMRRYALTMQIDMLRQRQAVNEASLALVGRCDQVHTTYLTPQNTHITHRARTYSTAIRPDGRASCGTTGRCGATPCLRA